MNRVGTPSGSEADHHSTLNLDPVAILDFVKTLTLPSPKARGNKLSVLILAR